MTVVKGEDEDYNLQNRSSELNMEWTRMIRLIRVLTHEIMNPLLR